MNYFVQQSNLYSQKKKNGRRFHTNAKVMKTFISVNNIMAVNQLPSTPVNWDRDHFVGNIDIHSIFTWTRHQVLQNLQFVSNTKQNKTDKDYKIRPIIDHLKESFQAVFPKQPEQNIDEHVTKFKGRASVRQYFKMKPIKWVLSGFDVLVPLAT